MTSPGKGVMDLLFSHSTLGADTLSQMEAAIHTMLGEELMLFEFNNHLLVQGMKSLSSEGPPNPWSCPGLPSPIPGTGWRTADLGAGRHRKLNLQAEASHQKKELEIIGQTVCVCD